MPRLPMVLLGALFTLTLCGAAAAALKDEQDAAVSKSFSTGGCQADVNRCTLYGWLTASRGCEAFCDKGAN